MSDDQDKKIDAPGGPIGGDIRGDAEIFLGAAIGEAEAGHHLVENQHHVVVVADFAQTGQETGFGKDHPLHRLDDDTGQVLAVFLDDFAGFFEVVKRSDQDR